MATDTEIRAPDSDPHRSRFRLTAWDLVPIVILVVGFGFWTIDKFSAAWNGLMSTRGLIAVVAIVGGYLLLWRVVLPRVVPWAWVRALLLSVVALALLFFMVLPSYDRDEKNERFVATAPAESDRRASGDGDRPAEMPPAPEMPVLVRSGGLGGLAGHSGSGTIEVIRDVDDTYVVQFTEVDIEGTPGPVVYLVPEAGAESPGGANLGGLQAEVGNFFYAGITEDLSQGDWTVLVWCEPFGVAVAGATVTPV
jgi:hypothetical protein